MGWTRETHIVQGNRTHLGEIVTAMNNPDVYLFVVKQNERVIACICVEKEENGAYIGLFSVHPDLQGKGIGKSVLQQAEDYALAKLGHSRCIMFVVSQRPELIAFYERRGYIRTGRVETYPLHLSIGIPRVKGLTIEYLEKQIQ